MISGVLISLWQAKVQVTPNEEYLEQTNIKKEPATNNIEEKIAIASCYVPKCTYLICRIGCAWPA
jgi:hypothetical protein